MSKFKYIIPIMLFLSLNVNAETDLQQEKETIKEDIKEVSPLSTSERIKIKIDEKKRLRLVSERRNENNDVDLTYLYINKLNFPELTKAFLRESVYYTRLLKRNPEISEIEPEVENISWNTICIGTHLDPEKFFVTFQTILSLELKNEQEEKNYELANEKLVKLFETGKPLSKEEISIRCMEVY